MPQPATALVILRSASARRRISLHRCIARLSLIAPAGCPTCRPYVESCRNHLPGAPRVVLTRGVVRCFPPPSQPPAASPWPPHAVPHALARSQTPLDSAHARPVPHPNWPIAGIPRTPSRDRRTVRPRAPSRSRVYRLWRKAPGKGRFRRRKISRPPDLLLILGAPCLRPLQTWSLALPPLHPTPPQSAPPLTTAGSPATACSAHLLPAPPIRRGPSAT